MSYDEFESQRVTEQRGYTWEVESDAIAWETAVDGVRTVQKQLSDLLGWGRDLPQKHVRAVVVPIHGQS